MKETTKIARVEYKKLIESFGAENILNKHLTEIVNRTGVSYLDLQNAGNYFKFRKNK